jgi:hypothetical protein
VFLAFQGNEVLERGAEVLQSYLCSTMSQGSQTSTPPDKVKANIKEKNL